MFLFWGQTPFSLFNLMWIGYSVHHATSKRKTIVTTYGAFFFCQKEFKEFMNGEFIIFQKLIFVMEFLNTPLVGAFKGAE